MPKAKSKHGVPAADSSSISVVVPMSTRDEIAVLAERRGVSQSEIIRSALWMGIEMIKARREIK